MRRQRIVLNITGNKRAHAPAFGGDAMVDIVRSDTSYWHVAGEYACQDVARLGVDERKPLDGFEFRHEPRSPHIDISPARAVRKGIDDAFCKRCARTVRHWLDQREIFLPPLADEIGSDGDAAFAAVENAPVGMCEACGKPDAGAWRHRDTETVVCATCRQALNTDYVDEGVTVGQFSTLMGETLAGRERREEPVEAPGWYRRRQRRENPENPRDIAVKEMIAVDGVSRRVAAQMYSLGIESVEEIAAEPDALTELSGFRETRAANVAENARRILDSE